MQSWRFVLLLSVAAIWADPLSFEIFQVFWIVVATALSRFLPSRVTFALIDPLHHTYFGTRLPGRTRLRRLICTTHGVLASFMF